jgi:hypothetical protein
MLRQHQRLYQIRDTARPCLASSTDEYFPARLLIASAIAGYGRTGHQSDALRGPVGRNRLVGLKVERTMELSPQNPDARILARLVLVFVFSTAVATGVEILLWRWETLLSFIVPFVIYILGSLRFLPWKTPVRKAISGGILLGMFTPLVLYTFGYRF